MNPAVQQLKDQIKTIEEKIKTSSTLLDDPDLKELASQDIKQLKDQKQALTDSLNTIINPDAFTKDSTQSRQFNNITLEIRQGAGGEEAKIWADDLMRMYTRYFETNNYKLSPLDNGVLKISGKNIYDKFKFESGVHRVQRVPSTESQGRIHTSTASVAILPIIPAQTLDIKEEDLDWQFFRSGGAGGQNVNKVNTAVRLTHKPTDLVVTCTRERKQAQNRQIALDLLRSQLWEIEEEKRLGSIEKTRKAAIGRAMRAEKIRTFNFPQNRVTDHRINKSWYQLDSILEGNIDDIVSTVSQTLSQPD